MISKLFQMNVILSHIMGCSGTTLCIRITGGASEETIDMDCFEIRDANGEGVTTKLANTIINNMFGALEDSKHHGTWFETSRSHNDFQVTCRGVRGCGICFTIMKAELIKSLKVVTKCRKNISNMAESLGVDSVKVVLKPRSEMSLC